MKVINVTVDQDTFNLMRTGRQPIDVRVNVPNHQIGDMIIYTMRDKEGNLIEDMNIAFLIASKTMLEFFVQRIGEQMMRKDPKDPDELIVVTLSPIGSGHIPPANIDLSPSPL